MQYNNKIFCLIAWPKAQFYLIEDWMNFKYECNKYIATITKGKGDSWNALKKATSIIKKEYQLKYTNGKDTKGSN